MANLTAVPRDGAGSVGKSNSETMECLADQMMKAGAPPQAVRFTRELYKQSHGDFWIMTGFHNLDALAFV